MTDYEVCHKCGGVTSRPETVGDHKYCPGCTSRSDKLKQALRELIDKSDVTKAELTECLRCGWGLPPETVQAMEDLWSATLKVKGLLP